MEELKLLYKELQERQEHLKSIKKTKATEGRIAENLLTIVRVQQLLLPLVAGQSEQLVCENCGDVSVEDEGNWCDKCLGQSEQLVCTFCDGTGGRVIYDTYLECKECDGSGAN